MWLKCEKCGLLVMDYNLKYNLCYICIIVRYATKKLI